MDKKLISILTFGLLTISIANILLSVGIVSLLFVKSPATDSQFSGTMTTALAAPLTNDTMSAALAKNMLGNLNTSDANVSGINATVTPVPSASAQTGMMPPAGWQPPAGGQPPAGWQPPSGSGQRPSSGQMPPSGSMQIPSSGGPSQSGSGSNPATSSSVPSGTVQAASAQGQYSPGSGQMPSASQLQSGSGLNTIGSAQLPSTGSGSSPAGSGNYPVGYTPLALPTAKPSSGLASWVNNNSNMFAKI